MALASDFCPGGTIQLQVSAGEGVAFVRGTICCFVFKKGESQLYLLTCGHVLSPPGKQRANAIVYDSDKNPAGVISAGDLLFNEKVLEGMDAGLAKVTKAHEMTAENFNVAGTRTPLTGMVNMFRVPAQNWDVMVRGARTAGADPTPKPGKMNDAGYSGRFKIVPSKAGLQQGLKWAEGDSGAPVYNQAGILLAMVTSGSGPNGVGAFSIGFVFKAFQENGAELEIATWGNRSQWEAKVEEAAFSAAPVWTTNPLLR